MLPRRFGDELRHIRCEGAPDLDSNLRFISPPKDYFCLTEKRACALADRKRSETERQRAAGIEHVSGMRTAEKEASIAMGDIDPRTRRLAHCRCDLRSDGIGFAFVGKEQPFIWPEP